MPHHIRRAGHIRHVAHVPGAHHITHQIPAPTEPKWLVEAYKCIGSVEGPGSHNNPAVVHFYAEAGHPEIHQDSVPWCAAFAGAMLRRAGIKGTGTLAARDYACWGQHLAAPVYGCVGVMSRGSRHAYTGHVGFVVGAGPRGILLLAGNQHDAVNVALLPRRNFIAFRWPANIPVVKHPLPGA